MSKIRPDAFEELVGEWIGDVGHLHKQIKDLPAAVDSALSPTRELLIDAQSNLAETLRKMPGAADQEAKRANEAASTALATQLVSVVGTLAGDSAAAEKHKSFYLAALVTTAFAIFFYCAGLMAAGFSNILLPISSMLLTAFAGVGFYWYMSGQYQTTKKGDFEPAILNIDTTCTDYQFKEAMKSFTGNTNVINAARDILVSRVEVNAAATKHQVHISDVLKYLGYIIERIKS